MDVGQIVVIHMRPDAETPYDCYLCGPVVEVRNGGLFVVEPTHYKPMPERWRPYDGVKRVLARKLDQQTGTHQLTYVGNEGGRIELR
jgi:hypothetical protein